MRAVIPEKRYHIEGSAEQGQWVELPWVAVFDKSITNTARHTFSISSIFSEVTSAEFTYLPNQKGVTSEMFTARMGSSGRERQKLGVLAKAR